MLAHDMFKTTYYENSNTCPNAGHLMLMTYIICNILVPCQHTPTEQPLHMDYMQIYSFFLILYTTMERIREYVTPLPHQFIYGLHVKMLASFHNSFLKEIYCICLYIYL